MSTIRLFFISILSIAFSFQSIAQEKNRKYESQTISAKKYPEKKINISSYANTKEYSLDFSESSYLSTTPQNYPNSSIKESSFSKSFFKSTFIDDIPVLNSGVSEENPSLIALENKENNSEIILAAEEWDGTNYTNLIFVKSNNHGLSWQKDSTLVISDSQSSLIHPKLTQISDSAFCVVFQRDWIETNQDIYIARIKNDLSESEILAVDLSPIKNINPAIVSDYLYKPNSPSLYVVYYQINGAQSKIIYRKSDDGGNTWSYSELASINTPEEPYCSISIVDSVLCAAFTHKTGDSDDIIGFVSTDQGENWSNFSFLAFSDQHERYPEVTVADSSYIFMMYESWYSQTDRDILYAYTEDAGSNWQINNALSISENDERYPDIKTLSGTPKIYSGFLNYTNNEVLVTNTLYITPSVWADPATLKKNTAVLYDRNPMALLPKHLPDGQNGVSAAWCQNQNNSDIYFNASWESELLTISGFVKTAEGTGINQVIMQDLPNSPKTDSTGFYSDQVVSGWSGIVTPEKEGWNFSPASKEYSDVTSDQVDQNYIGSMKTFTISGFITDKDGSAIEDVTLQGLPNLPVTDSLGFYSDTIEYHWSGTVTPVKEGWEFSPASRLYENIEGDQTDQNYQGELIKITISGFVKDSTDAPVENVILSGSPNLPESDTTGFYADSVDYNWTGVVTPEKVGWEFTPNSRVYQNITSDQMEQSYTAALIKIVITGIVTDSTGNPIQGVVLNGLPDNPISNINGVYSDSVYYGWSGIVTPTKQGLLFSPQNRVYENISQDQKDQNYIGSKVQYTVSGSIFDSNNIPNANVELTGLPGNPKTDDQGFYSAVVPSGWSGKVTPVKEGWKFDPTHIEYLNILSNQLNQNYSSSLIELVISGSVLTVDNQPLANIPIEGLPSSPVTDLSGFYSDTVLWGWSGTIKPNSNTWNFSPTERIFVEIRENQTEQNFYGSTIQFVISGFIKDSLQNPVSEVILSGFPGEIKTDSSGFYSSEIPMSWSGLITPQKEGWRFIPPSKQYTNVQSNISEENYSGILKRYVIAGYIFDQNQKPILDVVLNGLPNKPVTDLNGFYSDSVFFSWSGSIVPQKEGWNFLPLSRTYQQVKKHTTDQNFTGSKIKLVISGFVKDADNNPINNVVFQGLPTTPNSDLNGFYSDTLTYNWSGVVTPIKDGWEFSPASKTYNDVILTMNEENYSGTLISTIQEKKNVPDSYFLSQNYPNPFSLSSRNPSTFIEFGIPKIVHVSIEIYDVTGRQVAKLVDKTLDVGFHKLEWKSKDLPSGTYFLVFKSKKFKEVKKLILLR